jgi:exodeoxyribonuclease V alpha subunit
MTTIKATLMRVRAYIEQGGFAVLEYSDKLSGRKFTAVGVVLHKDRLCEGMDYDLSGSWKQHPTYGMQFAFDGLRRNAPKTETQVIRYLTKYCHGIGEKTAAAIYLRYEQDSIQALRERPAEVATAVPRLGLQIAMRCSESLKGREATEDVRAHLLDVFAGLRISDGIVEDCLKRWGLNAAEEILRNPYVMLDAGIERVGFRTADNVWLKAGKDPTAMQRQIRCLTFTLDSVSGSTWVPEHVLRQEWLKNLGDPRIMGGQTPPLFDEVIEHCESEEMIVRHGGLVAAQKWARLESGIARNLVRLGGRNWNRVKAQAKRRFAI